MLSGEFDRDPRVQEFCADVQISARQALTPSHYRFFQKVFIDVDSDGLVRKMGAKNFRELKLLVAGKVAAKYVWNGVYPLYDYFTRCSPTPSPDTATLQECFSGNRRLPLITKGYVRKKDMLPPREKKIRQRYVQEEKKTKGVLYVTTYQPDGLIKRVPRAL